MTRSEWQWCDRCLATLSLAIQKALRDRDAEEHTPAGGRRFRRRPVSPLRLLAALLLCPVSAEGPPVQFTQCTTEVTEKKAQLYHDLRRYYLSQDWGSSSFAARAHASFE